MQAKPRVVDHADLVVLPGSNVRLANFRADHTCGFRDKSDAADKLEADITTLAALQDIFYAGGRYGMLVIFQGMDAAGKDGAIKHVMSGINPQGVNVHSFKAPSTEDLAHDYLWRPTTFLPERGRIAIFNCSYYEEVGIVRVHPALLEREGVRGQTIDPAQWTQRFDDIVAFERHLVRSGTRVVKFFLHISKDEQRKRLFDRIDRPEKNWKISTSDIEERSYWDSYQHAYEHMLAHTSSEAAPWYLIPSDRKWFTRTAVADVLVAQLQALQLGYPSITVERRATLLAQREKLTEIAS